MSNPGTVGPLFGLFDPLIDWMIVSMSWTSVSLHSTGVVVFVLVFGSMCMKY